jgi:hypothetical protein
LTVSWKEFAGVLFKATLGLAAFVGVCLLIGLALTPRPKTEAEKHAARCESLRDSIARGVLRQPVRPTNMFEVAAQDEQAKNDAADLVAYQRECNK